MIAALLPPAAFLWLTPPLLGASLGLVVGIVGARLLTSRLAVERAVKRLVTVPRFLHETRKAIASGLGRVLSVPMKEILSRTGAARFLADHVTMLLARADTRAAIAQAAGAAARRDAQSLVTESLVESISGPLGRQLPVVAERIIRDPAQQRAVKEKILLAIRDWRNGESAGEDAAAPVTQIVGRYLESLDMPETRDNLRQSLESFLTKGRPSLGEFLSRNVGLEAAGMSESLSNAALAWVSRPQTAESLAEICSDGGLSSFLRGRFMRAAGLFGLALGLLVGVFQDVLFLLAR